MPCHRRIVAVIAVFMASLMPVTAYAQTVLTVHNRAHGTTQFSIDDLRKFPQIVVQTTTPWTEGTQRFVGAALQAVLGDLSGAESVTFRAVNDYMVTMPASEIDPQIPVVAYERNGTAMSVRDKGPLWLIYPFDDGDKFRTETVYSRSIWQLVEITVKE